jgi:hypothetical protein
MSKHKLINLIGTALFMLPHIAVIIYLWVSVLKSCEKKAQKLLILLLIIGSCSTIAAFFLAVDIMRWLGYIVFNNLFALAAVMMINKKYADITKEKLDKIKYLLILAAVSAIVFGPTQWMDGLEIVNKIAGYFGA